MADRTPQRTTADLLCECINEPIAMVVILTALAAVPAVIAAFIEDGGSLTLFLVRDALFSVAWFGVGAFTGYLRRGIKQ